MCITVTIGGKPLKAMIDCGSEVSLLKPGSISHLKNPQDTSPIFVQGVGGIFKTQGKVKLKMATHGFELEEATFHVTPKISHDVIIGLDILRANNAKLSVARESLEFHANNGGAYIILTHDSCRRSSPLIPVYAAATCTLKPGQILQVPATSNVDTFLPSCSVCNEGRLLFIDNNPCESPRISVVPGVTASTDNLTVLLLGEGTRNLKIRSGDQIGIISTYEPPAKYQVQTSTQPEPRPMKTAINLEEPQKSQVENMLEKYKLLFDPYKDFGRTTIAPHKIELTDTTPIYQKPRRFSEQMTEEIEAECRSMQSKGIIRPSTSPFSSPICPVRKPDGTLRLTIDYRLVNRRTRPLIWPIPNISDVIYGLKNPKYMTRLDCQSAFWQIDIDPPSRQYTAFSTPRGHWEFNKLSFGLMNSPMTFQREMQQILKKFPSSKVIIFIDDILLVEDESFEKHLELVEEVLHTLQEAGIKLNPEKCEFFVPEVKFLGHVINQFGIQKDPVYVEKVKKFPKPMNVRQMRQWLGLINYQRKFLPNAARWTATMTKQTSGRPKDPIIWNEEMDEAFEKLKEEMARECTLNFPEFSADAAPLELYVDASSTGCGSSLQQKQNGSMKVITYASTTFSDAQRRYSTIERELAALRWGIKWHHTFLASRRFILHTDHKPLLYLHNLKMVDHRLARTLEDIGEYSFEIRYKPGPENIFADALSRMTGDMSGITPPPAAVSQELPPNARLVHKVDGGGDSLFESLFMLLETMPNCKDRLPANMYALRLQLVEELLNNVKLYRGQSSKADMKCLRAMAKYWNFPRH